MAIYIVLRLYRAAKGDELSTDLFIRLCLVLVQASSLRRTDTEVLTVLASIRGQKYLMRKDSTIAVRMPFLQTCQYSVSTIPTPNVGSQCAQSLLSV